MNSGVQVIEFLARCRRGAADKVEDPAVLQPVIGEPLHLAVLVEIDRDHPLVDDPLVHECDRALGALRNVVENLAVEGRDRGGRSHHDQHLVLARADRNLLKRAGRQDVALLKLLAGAAAEHRAHQGDGGGGAHAAPARSDCARAQSMSGSPQSFRNWSYPLASREALTYRAARRIATSACPQGQTFGARLRNPQCFGRSITSGNPGYPRAAPSRPSMA